MSKFGISEKSFTFGFCPYTNIRFKIFPLTLFTIDPNSAQHVSALGSRRSVANAASETTNFVLSFTADNTTERRFRGGISLENSSPDDPTASFVAATDRRRRGGRPRETLEGVPGTLEETGPRARTGPSTFVRVVRARGVRTERVPCTCARASGMDMRRARDAVTILSMRKSVFPRRSAPAARSVRDSW